MNPLTPNYNRRLERERLRDEFAMAALATAPMIDAESIEKTGTELAVKATAQWAYRVADAMLAERERNNQ